MLYYLIYTHGRKICREYCANRQAVRLFELAGVRFKRQYDLDSYKKFFADAGFSQVDYTVIDGRMPCAVAVITKQ